ncbi:MAG: hypothetical protein HOC20_04865 [Chloroflexi bacterium]|jgi:hypothetical protein|nr:hypothetical protein [Chloroflexota bacterium]
MRQTIILALLTVSVAVSLLGVSCSSESLQTFDQCGISFTISDELELEVYSTDPPGDGPCNYNGGMIITPELEFSLHWLRDDSSLYSADLELLIQGIPIFFEGALPGLRVNFTGPTENDDIADYEIVTAPVEFTYLGEKTPGIAAVWHCPNSGRFFNYTALHEEPEDELKRFMRSLST